MAISDGVVAQSKTYAVGSVRALNPATQEFDGAWTSVELVQSSYGVWSAQIAFAINSKMNIVLNLNNIFDKIHYSAIGYPSYGNFYGEPRNFLLTLKASY